MGRKPTYERRENVQVKIKNDVHKLLREVAVERYGTEGVPWSVVIRDALEELSDSTGESGVNDHSWPKLDGEGVPSDD